MQIARSRCVRNGHMYGWTEDVLRDLARTSIEASFVWPDIKEKMRGNLSECGTGLETFEEKRS